MRPRELRIMVYAFVLLHIKCRIMDDLKDEARKSRK